MLIFVCVACSREPSVGGATDGEPTQVATNELVFDYPINFGDPIPEWTGLVERGNRASFSVVDDGRFVSSYALQVEIKTISPGDPWDIQAYREDIPVEPHNIYNYTAWLKGPVGAQVNVAVEGPDYLAMVNRDVILTGKWQQVAFEFWPEQEVVRTPIHFSFPYNSNTTIYIDDVTIEISE